MRATTIHAPFDVRLSEVPDPVITKPTDAVIKIVAGCICGSDLWPYRGENKITPGSRIGHEYVGIVQEIGSGVRTVKPGDFVVTPFVASDGTCPNCLAGLQSVCQNLVGIGSSEADGGQGEYAKVPWADGTLVATPEVPDDSLVPSLLTLSDVMGTGWHAARSARVKAGDTVVVVGDGAVGLCGVLAAVRMGADRVIAMSRHEPRQKIAQEFGATHIIAERGDEATTAVQELTDGVGRTRYWSASAPTSRSRRPSRSLARGPPLGSSAYRTGSKYRSGRCSAAMSAWPVGWPLRAPTCRR